MVNFFIYIIFYLLILYSLIGYGNIFSNIFIQKKNYISLGYVGIYGIFTFIFFSYLISFFIPHNFYVNSLFVFIGFSLFIYYFLTKKIKITKTENLLLLSIALLLIIFTLGFKTHDDFNYYHFPYTYYLTQQKIIIGIGELNHGFRTPSSIFYFNSMFYLPLIKYYSLNFGALYIWTFANIILLKKIYTLFVNQKLKFNINYETYLSLLVFIFINIFFYRVSEHGTDRSAQILIFILFIELLCLFNLKYDKKIIYNILILTTLIISLKAFYILYLVIFFPIIIFLYNKKKENLIKIFKIITFNKVFIISAIFCLLIFSVYFLNTGCVIYPLAFTCFDNLIWSISKLEVNQMNNWYELWSKAGANPNFRVENPDFYITSFNWVGNWLDNYFFNKVSDFLFGIIFLMLIIFISIFYKKNTKKIEVNRDFKSILLILFLLFIEWFYNHPALRYGGYSLIALIFFIPFSIYIEKLNISYSYFKSLSICLIIITLLVFVTRNMNRINFEIKKYNYKPFLYTFYDIDKSAYRIHYKLNNKIKNFNNCEKKLIECDLEESSNLSKFSGLYVINNK